MTHPNATHAQRRESGRRAYVSFRLDDQWLGIPVVQVQEVLTHQAISRIPLAPREISGFLNLRGQIVTAVDLRSRLALPERGTGEGYMNIVVWNAGEPYSLLVDEVGDVVEVSVDRLEPTPATLDAVWRQCCEGVLRLERGLLAVLSVERLLEDTGTGAGAAAA